MTLVKYALYAAGLASVTYGAWLIYRPAGFLVGGVLAVLISMAIDHAKEKEWE